MSDLHLRPGMLLGSYPQKKPTDLNELELQVQNFFKQVKKRFSRRQRSMAYISRQVSRYQAPLR